MSRVCRCILLFAVAFASTGCLGSAAAPTLVSTLVLPAAEQMLTITPAPPTAAPDPGAPIWIANPIDRTVLRIDPIQRSVATVIEIEGRPETAVVGEGAVWVLDQQHELVFRIDPSSNRVTGSIPLPDGRAESITTGAGSVLVGLTGKIDLEAQQPGGEEELIPPAWVLQIDPVQMEILEKFPVQPVSSMVVDGTALWVLSKGVIDTPLQVIDLKSKQGMSVPFRNAPEWLPADSMAIGSGGLWLFSAAYGKVFHAAPDGLILSAISFPEAQPTGYADLLLAEGSLWAATPWGTVMRIDPATNHVSASIELQAPLTRLISAGGAVWALSQQIGVLFRIDPAANSVSDQIPTGSRVQPTVIPTPTPRVVIWQPCPDGPTSRLKVGDIAYVTKDPPVPNRVRKEPNRQAEILGTINPAGSMDILEGPTCADGWVWWKVKNADYEGWMAEGDRDTYWMVPLYK